MIVLLCLAILGCTREPRIVYKRPVCAPAELAVLPVVTAGELADVPKATYWKLQTRERLVTDWALENEAIIERVCVAP